MRRLSSPFLFPFSLLTSAIIITILNAVATSAVSPDGLALLAFKSAVSGDPESALASWDEDDADPCRWPGISCANFSSSPDPRVVGIAVSGKNLSGYMPSELGSLVFLRRLNLHGNRLSGPIPSQLFNASSLHSLFLYDNNLSGPLPPSLCDPPRLQNLDLSRNSLSGNLPVQIRGCRQIQRLILAENRFSGEISAGIWPEMVGLIQIDLSSNNFDGPLPPDIGELDSLTGTLNLSHNSFSGSIPKSLGNLPPVVSLDLRYNNLSGEIPQSGSLANQGPTAFLNNPALCGFPLQIPCQGTISAASAAPPGNRGEAPEADSSPSGKKGLRPGLIVLISMTDAAGVALIGLILVYVYWKLKDKERKNGCSCTGKSKLGGGKMDKGQWRCRFCCKGTEASENDDDDDDENDSESAGNEAGEGRLVAMDRAFEFELDELLRASAYVLGKGGLGIVYKVVLGNGVPVAVRRLGEGGGQRYKEFAGEVQAISKVRHPNVVRLRAYYWAQDEKLLISDFIPNGNLAAALRGRSTNPSLSWSIRLKIAKGSARGLVHLHECSPRKFVHGDIKPSNILLDNDFNPYVSDFGLNRLMSIAASTNPHDATPAAPGGFIGAALPSSAAATPRSALDRPNPYRAPESRFPSARPTQKWDVFSLGVVLLEMLTGRQPETAATHVAAGSSAASTSCCSTEEKGAGPELVRWVRKGFEDARPLAEMVDPVLLREVQAKKEVVAAFHVALACTEPDPEARPRMKTLSDNLDRIGQ